MSGPLRIGLAGLGTVGAGVVQILSDHAEKFTMRSGRPVAVTAVCARDRNKDRGVDLSPYRWENDAQALAVSEDIDVFVEMIGGEDGPAYTAVVSALKAGKHVVTANKALLAKHGSELAALAESRNLALNFEAAVAAGIPIVKTLREGLSANEISRVYGILNGTCNHILTDMEASGRSFDVVLREAQELGYAEEDPTFDVGGIDTAHKLALLTSLAFGCAPDFDGVFIEGIEHITALDLAFVEDFGYRIKLLGVARHTSEGIEQRVHPCLVPLNSAIAAVQGVYNSVVTQGDSVGETVLEGQGAGRGPTASAVIADIVDIARGNLMPVFGIPAKDLKPAKRAPMEGHEGAFYVRLSAQDRSGVIAGITSILADEKVSIESMVQHGAGASGMPPGTLPVAIMTHETKEEAMTRVRHRLEEDRDIVEPPRIIRIENL